MRRLWRRYAGRLPKPLSHTATDVPRDSGQLIRRRRRAVAAASTVGAGMLGLSLSTRPGSREFYLLTLGTAGTWTAGSLVSGPLHLGYIEHRDERLRRPAAVPLLTGVAAFAGFYGAALVAREVPVLDQAIRRVLLFAEEGATPMVWLTACANGVAEELFFRGALYTALDGLHPVVTSTAVYTLATLPTRNPALVLAASAMGTLFALQRRASGGVQAPALTHLAWSTLMLRYLPPLFGDRTPRRCASCSSPTRAT